MKLSTKFLICTLAFFLLLAGIIFGMSFLWTDVPEDGETSTDEQTEEDLTLGPPIETADEDDFQYMTINGGKEYAILSLSEAEGAENIIIPEEHNGLPVTAIGNGAFTADMNLRKLIIPDSVLYIGTNAFNGCTNLTDITISDNLKFLGIGAFGDCEGIEYKEYNGAYYFGDKDEPYKILAYAKDRSITSCDIHPDTKIICEAAFANCTELSNVTIPDGIVYVGQDAFDGCLNLEYTTDGSASYLGNAADPYLVCIKGNGKRTATTYTIHEGTKIIVSKAFKNCPELTHITLPKSLSAVGAYALDGCPKLIAVKFSDISDWSVVNENNIYNTALISSDSDKIVEYFTETSLDCTWIKH